MKNIATTVQHTSTMRGNKLGKGRTQSRYITSRARSSSALTHHILYFCIVFLTCSLSFAFSLLTLRCIFSQSCSICVCLLAVADFNVYGYVCLCLYSHVTKISHFGLTHKICAFHSTYAHEYVCIHRNLCIRLLLLILFILLPRRKSRMFHCTSERSYCHTN